MVGKTPSSLLSRAQSPRPSAQKHLSRSSLSYSSFGFPLASGTSFKMQRPWIKRLLTATLLTASLGLAPLFLFYSQPEGSFGLEVGSFLEVSSKESTLRSIASTNLSAAAAKQVTASLDCMSSQGTWIYDSHPRPIPWEPTSLAHCDLMWLRRNSSFLAGPVANMASLPEEWAVRDTLKYRWQVAHECNVQWREFDRTQFCDALDRLGGPMLFVGDSVTRGMFQSVYNHLYMGDGSITTRQNPPLIVTPDPCSEWEQKGLMPEYMLLCKALWSCRGEGSAKGQIILHVRNDRLTLQKDSPVEKSWDFYLPWVDLIRTWGVKAVVLNRGVHFSKTRQFRSELESTLAALRKEFPDLFIVYRSSPAGHPGCANSTRPYDSASSPLAQEEASRKLPYNWGYLHEQNLIAKVLVEKYGGVFLDVEPMTNLRPDGHFGLTGGKVDCLHYCAPGPMDSWVQLLFNALLLLDLS